MRSARAYRTVHGFYCCLVGLLPEIDNWLECRETELDMLGYNINIVQN